MGSQSVASLGRCELGGVKEWLLGTSPGGSYHPSRIGEKWIFLREGSVGEGEDRAHNMAGHAE